MATLSEGRRAIERIIADLQRPADLEHAYAVAILQQAASRARSKPTPQARMAYEALSVSGSRIAPSAGGPSAEVGAGSEFGSVLYTQFGPRNEGGYWLHPAAEDRQTIEAGDRALEDLLETAIRGFSLG